MYAMTVAQRLGVLVVALGMLTVVTLPESTFAKGVDAATRFVTGTLGTAMGKGIRN